MQNLNNSDFTWTSTNEDIAKVNGNGQVTGLKDGYTTIYATYKYTDEEGNEKTILAECIINVASNIAVPQTETGNGFTVVLKADGTVWNVGAGPVSAHEETNNTQNDNPDVKPLQVKISETENLTNIVKISAGTNEILALTKFGEIYTYNVEDKNATKNTILTNIVDISAGNNTYSALDKDGNVYTWDNETEPTKQNIENIIRVSSGNGNIGALEVNGVLWSWGENGKGQLGLNSKTNLEYPLAVTTNVTEISSGGVHAVIQKIDKKLYATGDMYQTALFEEIALPETVTNSNPVKYFKTGYNTTTIMLKDGTVYGEGGNLKGELGIGTSENASRFTQGLTLDTSNDIAENDNLDDVGESPVSIHPITNALMIGNGIGDGETSSLNTTVITTDGYIYTSGDNTQGQIGNGTTENTTYYTRLGYATLDYEDKEIILDETGYQIDINKLKYIETTINVYDNHTPLEVGQLEYTSADTSLATVDSKGFITAKKMSGTTEITIKDITNGYEAKITVLVNRLLVDTDTITYIYNIDDLVKFRESVNAGNNYAGKTVYVMADIDMSPACSEESGVSWTPIGVYEEGNEVYFEGTFDGNYHTLSNLYYNSDSYYNAGLFDSNNGVIQNVIMEDIYINNSRKDSCSTGGIAGDSYGSVQNCSVSGEIIAVHIAGGILGRVYGNINGCINYANVTAVYYNSTYAGSAGGITGRIGSVGQIENCYNKGTIKGNSTSVACVGGIIGHTISNTTSGSYIKNCYNIGTIGTAKAIGAIIGQDSHVTYTKITNNYWLSGCGATYGRGYSRKNTGAEKVSEEELKTYTETLGAAYENDDFNINEEYPILWWQAPTIELNKKQAYIRIRETLQLEIIQNDDLPNAMVGKTNITNFNWSSTNEDVATVNQNGVVTGLTEGYTTIYGKHKQYENIYVMCIINVAKAKNIAVPQVETGNGFTAILKADGTVWMTGNPEIVATGTGANIATDNNPDDVGAPFEGIPTINLATPNLTGLEENSDTTVPAQIRTSADTYLENVIKISAGPNHVLALTENGEVYTWGKNYSGQLGIGNNENTNYATLVTGEGGASTLKRIVDISAGENASIAVNEFGWIYVWGNGTNGEFGNGGTTSSSTPVKTVINKGISVSIGEGHVIVQGQNGKAYTWGQNNKGQLGIGNQENNTVVGKIADGITDISAGGNATIVKNIEGKVYGTGLNSNGELGIDGNEDITTLTQITLPDVANVKYIKSGKTNTTLMLSNGTVWSTGVNTNGELGNGNNDNSSTFVQGLTLVENEEEPLTSVLMIGRNSGGLNTEVIVENGDIYATGDNTYLQISDSKIASTNYYHKMEFYSLDYADKVIEIDLSGYTIDKNKLKYLYETINVYNNEEQKELTLGEIGYEPVDTSLIKVSQSGHIKPLKNEGTTELKIKDITNGYYTTIKVIVKNNTIQNTDTVLYIYNIDDLVKFRDSVNAGNDYLGKTVYVMADIDMSPACSEESGISWEPIGTYADEEGNEIYFAGTFEGNYHTLSNLYYDSDTHKDVGLFSSNNGTIQNVMMDDIYINNSYKTDSYTGGIASMSYGSVQNCSVSGEIIGRHPVGGIVGGAVGNVNGCINYANVTGVYYSTRYSGVAGGIVGMTFDQIRIENCYNKGSVKCTSTSSSASGGIVGSESSSTKSGSYVKNCYNTGTIDIAKYKGAIIGNDKILTITNNYWLPECGATYGRGYSRKNTGAEKVSEEELKTYTETLGAAYENDDFNINEEYPILWWQAPTIELNEKQAYIKSGEQLQLEVVEVSSAHTKENLDNLEIKDFIWSSTNEDIATVNQNGVITGLTEGYTTIYGKHKQYENIYAMCIINVAKEIAVPQVETGNGFKAMLKVDGTVWMTGNPEIVATGTGGRGMRAPITDENTTNAENNNLGNVMNIGADNMPIQQVRISETEYLTDVIKISAGPNHVLALTENGEVYTWGKNYSGQLGIGNNENTNYATLVTGEGGASTLKRIVDISAGENASIAVNEFGWIYVWGNGTNGEFGNGGTNSSNTPVKTVISKGISASIGSGHVISQRQNGKAYTWGKNDNGQLGINSTENNLVVGKIADGITDISAGGNETIIKDIDRNVYGTGKNTSGELGIEGNEDVTTLTQMNLPDVADVKYIKAGATNTTLMLSNGTVWATGVNTNGELGNGTGDNSSTFVQGMTLIENGEKTESPEINETENPDALTSVLTVGRNNGGLNTVVILENGAIYATGNNTYSQITNETEENTNYYVPMRYIEIIAPEEIDLQVGESRTLTEEELEYTKDKINIYKEDKITISLIDHTQTEDEKIATYEQGKIDAIEVGITKLKVENEEYDILFYIPVKVYGKIIGSITTENHEGKHIADVTLYKSGEETMVIETITQEDGTYEIKVYESGLYDLEITKLGYLDTKIINIEVGETDGLIEVEEQALIAGDVAVSGEIEIDDLVDMNENVGEDITEENKETKSIFDLNEDGKIDMLDRVILKNNYGKIAEPIQWVKPNRRRRKMTEEDETVEDVGENEYTISTADNTDISVITSSNGEVLVTRLEEKYLVLPITCDYKISSNYGYRTHPTTGEEKLHAGIDLVGEHHTEILSIADGEVTYAGVQNGYGNCIEIKHIVNGETIYSFYAHLSRIDVKVGEKVKVGDVIGLEGGAETDPNHGTSTGHHLHFEIRTASGSGHSIDPTKYIEF